MTNKRREKTFIYFKSQQQQQQADTQMETDAIGLFQSKLGASIKVPSVRQIS